MAPKPSLYTFCNISGARMAGWSYNWPQHLDPIWLVSWWAGLPDRDSGVTLLSRYQGQCQILEAWESVTWMLLVVIHSCSLLTDWARPSESWLLITEDTKHECFHQSEATLGQFSCMLVSLQFLEGCDMQTPTAPLWPGSGQLGTLWWARRLISFASHRCCSPHSWVDWHWLCGIGDMICYLICNIGRSILKSSTGEPLNIMYRWRPGFSENMSVVFSIKSDYFYILVHGLMHETRDFLIL